MDKDNRGFYRLPRFQFWVLISFIVMLIVLLGPWAYKVVESTGICLQIYIHYVEYFMVPIIGFISGIVTLKKTGLIGKNKKGGDE